MTAADIYIAGFVATSTVIFVRLQAWNAEDLVDAAVLLGAVYFGAFTWPIWLAAIIAEACAA